MKTLILIFFFSLNLFAQSQFLLLMDEGNSYIYDSDASNYLASLTTPLSEEQSKRIDTLIIMLKDSLGITALSDSFDVIYLFANETEEAGLKNLVTRSNDAIVVEPVLPNTILFTQWEGFTGDGANAYGYINSNYNPSTEGTRYTLNSASIGAYSRDTGNPAAAEEWFGVQVGSDAVVTYVATNGGMYYYVNNAADNSHSEYAGAWNGLMFLNRTASNSFKTNMRGVFSTATAASTPTVIPNGNIYILANNKDGSAFLHSSRQFAFFFAGSSLSELGARKLNNCIEWYLDELGTGVE